MLIFSKDWKEKKDEPYVYNPDKLKELTCDLHNMLSIIIPPDPETDPTTNPGGTTPTPDAVTPTVPGPMPETQPTTTVPETSTTDTRTPTTPWYEGPITIGD